MVLIIGGAYQGKRAYAMENFPDNSRIYHDYHLTVREQIREARAPVAEAERLLADEIWKTADTELVIVSDEVGYGLVPTDAFEREYRELSGRVNCYLAREATQVIRVVCGIGVRIK